MVHRTQKISIGTQSSPKYICIYIFVSGNSTYRVSQKAQTHFNRLQLKNWIVYESFFHITKVGIKCHFFNNFGKTVNLNFNGLTGVNSLRSIYLNKDAKKKIYQIYLRTTKLPNLIVGSQEALFVKEYSTFDLRCENLHRAIFIFFYY